MSFVKKLYIVLLVLFMQSYTFASYYTPDINKDCTLESYNKINEFINKCGVNERIANEEVFLDKKFTGKYPTLLYAAVVFNDLKMVKKLVTLGADVNELNYFPESSALMKAVENNNIEMVKYLLDKGADVNQTTPKYYLSAIDFAATYEMASLLLSHNAKVDKINGYTYYTPLQKAILLKNNQMIKAYLPKSNIYQKDYLFEKDALSNEDIIKTLSNIVDKNKKEVKLRENVSAAILYDKIKSSNYSLFNIYKDIDKTDDYYALIDPLMSNVLINEHEPYRIQVESLSFPQYEASADLFLKDFLKNNDTYVMYFPITAAVTYNDIDLLQVMLDANHLKKQYYREDFKNLFAIAVFNGNIDIIKLLMMYNYPAGNCAPPLELYENEEKSYTCTALLTDILSNYESNNTDSQEIADYKKMYEMFEDYESSIYDEYLNSYIRDENNRITLSEDEILKSIKSKPVGLLNDTNYKAEGLLHIAFRNNYERLASYLIINGFDIFDNYNRVPLEYTNNNKYIQQLLIMGENMYLGEKPAVVVFNNAGDTEKLKLFIKYGLDVNVRNQLGKPVLFEAVEKQSLDSVKLLIENGANLDDLYKGVNIMQYGEKFGTKKITKYLKSKISEKGIKFQQDSLMESFENNQKE